MKKPRLRGADRPTVLRPSRLSGMAWTVEDRELSLWCPTKYHVPSDSQHFPFTESVSKYVLLSVVFLFCFGNAAPGQSGGKRYR